MNVDGIDAYLSRLRVELRKRGLADARIVEEARGHLADATEQGIQRGLSADVAQQDAIARFGAPESVAANFAAGRYHQRDRLLFVAAVLVGLAIAYNDSRPNWDDAGVTALLMTIAAAVLGLIAPRRPWLWALAIGMWIPLYAMARSLSLEAVTMLIVLVFPFAGAYAGMALGRVRPPVPEPSSESGVFHDKSPRFHCALRSKRGWVNPELAAIVADPTTQLVPFLERVAPPPLGPLGELQSLTVVDDGGGTANRPRRYRAVFGHEEKIICTVAVGRKFDVSIDWHRVDEPKPER